MTMRSTLLALLTVLPLAATAWGQSPQPDLKPEERAARAMLADRLVDDARTRGRDTSIKSNLAARQAATLLQAANRLDPANTETLTLLAEAARASGQPDLMRDTLRQLLRLDGGNLVAQVGFLDSLAMNTQAMEERLALYANAAGNAKLDPQVRSEMFMRVAKLHAERGENAEARDAISKALELNDVNLGALRELARLAASERKPAAARLATLVSLLKATPYETDAWLAGGRLLAAANLHDTAADFFVAGLEQIRAQQGNIPPTLLFEMALELAAADRLKEAVPVLDSLSQLEDAPAGVNLARALLRDGPVQPARAAATAPATAPATTPAGTQPGDALRKQLDVMLAANPDDATAIAAVLYTTLAHVDGFDAKTADAVEAYANRKDADADTAARLRGWLAFRQNDLAGAKARLTPLAERDPQAALGLAHVALAEKDNAALRKVLDELYAGHPTGLTALHVITLARTAGIRLTETSLTKELALIAKNLPAAHYTAHRQPRELQLMIVTPQKRRVEFGEPILVDVRVTNAWDGSLPVGPNAPIKTQLALAGVLRGTNAQSLGAYAFEQRHRTYRLDRRQSLNYTVRIDQGLLADLLWSNPLRTVPLSISLMVEPNISVARDGKSMQVLPGLGGQILIVGDLERAGYSVRDLVGFVREYQGLERLPRNKQLGMTALAVALTASLPANGGTASNATEIANARKDLIAAVLGQIKSGDALVAAFAARMAPLIGLPAEIEEAFSTMATAEDPTAQAMYVWRKQARAMVAGRAAYEQTSSELKKFSAEAKDTLVKAWAAQLAEQLDTAPTTATAPATRGATTRSGPAGTQPIGAERFTQPEKVVTPPTSR